MWPDISVIIPTLNELPYIGACLDSVREGRYGVTAELIVVDGGSVDGTPDQVCAQADVRLVRARAGRAYQLNAGARLASGDVLVFLHADCRLGGSGLLRVRDGLERSPDAPGGAFRMVVDHPAPYFRLLERIWHSRLRMTGICCGDQAMFLRRTAFAELGGFPDQELMEDVELSLRMRRVASPLIIEDPPVVSSPRRWIAEGVAYGTIRNWLVSAGYVCGLNTEVLKQFYPDRLQV